MGKTNQPPKFLIGECLGMHQLLILDHNVSKHFLEPKQ